MNDRVKKIFDDLCALDVSFRGQEKELLPLIERLLQAEPDTKFDATFAAKLRRELMAAVALKRPVPSFWTLSAFRYSIGTVFVIALFAVSMYGLEKVGLPDIPRPVALKPATIRLGDRAFGELAFGTNAPESEGISAISVGMGATGVSGAAPLGTSQKDVAVPSQGMGMTSAGGAAYGMGGGIGMTAPAMPIVPEFYTTYSLKYAGAPLTLTETQGLVYQRVRSGPSSAALLQMLARADIGFVDWRAFADLKVRNIDLVEDKDFGYAIGVNFNDGVLYINPNWERWQSEQMGETFPVGGAPLDDAAAIGIAKDFLIRYGIDLASYGAPEVQNDNYLIYSDMPMSAGESGQTIGRPEYFPPQVSVVFPLLLDGRTIHDGGGNAYGISVMVDSARRRVWSASNITTRNYQSSAYDLETDPAKIIALAEQGGTYDNYGYGGGRVVNLKLGTPTVVLTHHYVYQNNGTDELFVPALSFPVLDKPQDYYASQIIVPLVKDLFADRPDMPVPMPLGEPLVVKPSPGEDMPPAALLTQKLLAGLLGRDADTITIARIEAVDWPDSCLGISEPNTLCAQLITPGYRIILEVDGKTYEYHTNTDGTSAKFLK